MAFLNPSDSTEVFYGSSGDVRNEINAFLGVGSQGHYSDEQEIPGALILRALQRATRTIDTYLKPVYADSLPFTAIANVPKFLDEAASDMATYLVFRSTSVLLGKLPDQKKIDYWDQYTLAPNGFLVLISLRMMQLPELSASQPNEAQEARSNTRPAIFDLDEPLDQEVSPGLLEDIADQRDEDA